MPGKSKKGGGLESKPAYNLKPVPADKQKSLGKLPTDVRNKMGYQMNYKMVNKEGLKMAGNPAYKLDPTTDFNFSLINDPSKLSGLDLPNIGDNINYQGENMNVLGVDVNKIFRTKTYDDMRAAGASEEDINKAKAFNQQKYGTINPTAAGKTNNQVLDSFNAVVNLGSIPQPGTPEVKGDAFTSYDKRQEIRQGKNITGQSIRNKNKIERAKNRIEKLNRKSQNTGLDSKNIFGNKNFVKKQLKLQDKIDKTTNRKEGLEERQGFINTSKSNYKKQIEQGINPTVGKKGRVILQGGKEGSSTTSALPNVKEIFESDKIKILKNKLAQGTGNGMKPMQLSPKAMNYFNKKNKK